jgi:hypothetical protein
MHLTLKLLPLPGTVAMTSPLGLRIGPDCAKGNLPNGIATRTLANVTNFAITSSGTMLLNGIESTSAQPAYFHIRNQKQHKASPARFISRRNATWRVRLLLKNNIPEQWFYEQICVDYGFCGDESNEVRRQIEESGKCTMFL